MNIDKLIDQVLRHEGGFVDDPDDKGGTTNWGISKKVYAKFLGVDSTYIYLSHLIKLMPNTSPCKIEMSFLFSIFFQNSLKSYMPANPI
mgnify:CR=1 FL=1